MRFGDIRHATLRRGNAGPVVRGPCFLAGHLVGTQHTACAPLNSRSTQPLKPEDLCVSPQRPHVRGVSGLWPLEQIPSPSTPFRVTSQMRKLRPGVGGDWHIVTYAARRGLEPGFLTPGSSQAASRPGGKGIVPAGKAARCTLHSQIQGDVLYSLETEH